MNKPLAMIIDDDRDIVALFRNVLDLAGYRTEIILHGQTAVERLSTTVPDIVLLDLNLPGISGIEILHLIRSNERFKNTRTMVITGYSHIAQTLEDEPDLVLLKPVNIDQLTSLLQRLTPTKETMSAPAVDELTGFYNRSFFQSRLEYSLARLKQLELSHFTILITDLQQFPTLERQLGAPAGRQLVIESAMQLKNILRPTDTIAHLDGAKFAILVEDVRHWDIPIMLANRIIERIEKKLAFKGFQSNVNVGIILCHIGYDNVEDIMRDAEASLALAQKDGKNGYRFFARDNFNNSYNLEMIADMISIAGAAPLTTNQPRTRNTLRVTPLPGPNPIQPLQT